MMEKRPHDIDEMMARIEEAVRPFPKAALFELAEEGYDSAFEQLCACIISIRTRDEVTLPTARRLFQVARTPTEVSRLAPEEIDARIGASSFHGVGVKCANLVLAVACRQPCIAVDIHVHRVTNRWGYVHAPTPEQTLVALEAKLPERYWIDINRLLVPFGKHICTGTLPKCSTCPVLDMCQQVGVTKHR